MDFSTCECSQPGFCHVFNKQMTSDPPNWQWCQSASPEERRTYKSASDKGITTKSRRLPSGSGKIISHQDLIKDTRQVLLPKILKDHNISAVLGVPRSGMIPATVIATSLSIPLMSISNNEPIVLNSFSINGGKRMRHHDPTTGKVLIIDDTVYSGSAATAIKEKFPHAIMSAVYVLPKNKDIVDYYAKEVTCPHILEWNFFDSLYVTESAFDIDGILNANVPVSVCQDETTYIDYIENIEPFYERIPRLFTIQAIVTGRLEKYRDITTRWLDRHGVKYGRLIMLPNELEHARNANHAYEVGRYKAGVMKELGVKYFVESELSEARIIRRFYENGIIICPNDGVYI